MLLYQELSHPVHITFICTYTYIYIRYKGVVYKGVSLHTVGHVDCGYIVIEL